MKKYKILIGTGNKGKQEEYRRIINFILNKHQRHSCVSSFCHSRANGNPCICMDSRFRGKFSFLFPQEIGLTEEPVETGKTFEENARIKAEFYYKKSGIPSLGDDGGMEIPILNNEPGVTSRRWKGYEMTDLEIVKYTLGSMKKYKGKAKRTAYLTVTLTYTNGIDVIVQKESVKGYVADEPCKKQTKGYPFRRVFIVEGLGKYYEELTEEEHEKYNHREKAFNTLIKKLTNNN